MNLMMTPQSSQAVAVPAATDWIAISKTIAIEIVFVGSTAAVIFHPGNPDVISIVWATGLALGVLRISDVVANVINVKSFLAKPASGVVPQAAGTPLIATTPVTPVDTTETVK
jgi:hypothetical protein